MNLLKYESRLKSSDLTELAKNGMVASANVFLMSHLLFLTLSVKGRVPCT